MSEASRQRWLYVKNRLEELRSKYGDVEVTTPDALDHAPLDTTPSWGPVGSLAEQLMDAYDFGRLLEQHDEMVRMERAARMARGEPLQPEVTPEPAEADTEPPPQKRVLDASQALQQLDSYGETPLYACPLCGEESAKASVRIQRWHCTACDAWGQLPSMEPPRGTRLNQP